MIPANVLPQEQEELKKRLQYNFLLNCLILDCVEKGLTGLYIGKIDFTPDTAEYRVWTSNSGRALTDEYVTYLYKGPNYEEAQELFLAHAYDEQYLPTIEQVENPERLHNAQVYITEDTTEESPYVSDEDIDQYEDLLDQTKENFILNAHVYDFASDIVNTYVVGYVGLHEDDPFAEWRIWCTENSPTSPDGHFIADGLDKQQALNQFNQFLNTKGLL